MYGSVVGGGGIGMVAEPVLDGELCVLLVQLCGGLTLLFVVVIYAWTGSAAVESSSPNVMAATCCCVALHVSDIVPDGWASLIGGGGVCESS